MTPSNEYEYLIHLLYCALHEIQPQEVPTGISAKKVFAIGAEHEVANIAYAAVVKLKTLPDEELMKRWKEFYIHAVKRDALQKRARTEIVEALAKAGVCTLEVQGTRVKGYYPQSHMRMMSDLDFIIPLEKLAEAKSVMQSLGYEIENIKENEIDAHKDVLNVELHTEFFDEDRDVHAALSDPFSYAEYAEDGTANVSDTVFYLYHLLHTVKHCMRKGAGLRRIIDLYYLDGAMREKADIEYIDKVLKEHGFYETKAKLISAMEHWFGDKEPDPALASFERGILEAGNHGSNKTYYRNVFEKERTQGKHFVKLKHLCGILFPPKEEIYKSYPFCEKHRYPTVLCWLHRMNAGLFSKEKRKKAKSVLSRMKIK